MIDRIWIWKSYSKRFFYFLKSYEIISARVFFIVDRLSSTVFRANILFVSVEKKESRRSRSELFFFCAVVYRFWSFQQNIILALWNRADNWISDTQKNVQQFSSYLLKGFFLEQFLHYTFIIKVLCVVLWWDCGIDTANLVRMFVIWTAKFPYRSSPFIVIEIESFL